MTTTDLAAKLVNALEHNGYKGKVVSTEHCKDLETDINALYRQGLFDEEFFSEELNHFDFRVTENLGDKKSLIITAAPQPQVRATFTLAEKELTCIIPPTYSYATDAKIEDLLRRLLQPAGFHLKKAKIPCKLLAVRSGLARYGKNNISYAEGLGSFYRLAAFVSDLPCAEDSWGEVKTLEECNDCDACARACPSGAIGSERFLIHAERCLTFYNERHQDFPAWLNPSWHNCLVGCMICQTACPANKTFRKQVDEGPLFSEKESACLLQNVSQDELPRETVRKLDQLNMTEYLNILKRNLQALAAKQKH